MAIIAPAAGALPTPALAVPAPCTVFIRDLAVSTVIGVHGHERLQPRVLLMDLDLELAASTAGASDRIDDTIDYAAVVAAVRAELADQRYYLLERLAEVVAELLLRRFGARRVRLTVAKTGILPGVGRVGVAIERVAAQPQAATFDAPA